MMDKMPALEDSVRYLKGVGPKRAELFGSLGITTVGDLLEHFPFRVEDYSKVTPMNLLADKDSVTVQGTVTGVDFANSIRGPVLRVRLHDGGGFCVLVWYNMPFMAKNFRTGKSIVASGKVEWRRSGLEMAHPLWKETDGDLIKGPIISVYAATTRLPSKTIAKTLKEALKVYLPAVSKKYKAISAVMTENGYYSFEKSLKEIHEPDSYEAWSKARESLSFKEMLELQVAFSLMRIRAKEKFGPEIISLDEGFSFLRHLPFDLTGAQKRAIDHILKDFKSQRPMNRLLQGDVGCGKTVVALWALLTVCDNGYQGVFLAPTDILARQHLQTVKKLAGDDKAVLLTGSMTQKEKDSVKEKIRDNSVRLVVGTHAVLSADMEWHSLGMVVTDEQHRFGVKQRLSIAKGSSEFYPHILTMSATPIPRSLALTLYGDLDITVIDELPPGRKPVKTYVVTPKQRAQVYSKVMQEISKGRQAYVVCPVIEESESGARSVEEVFKELKKGFLKNAGLSILHGGIKREQTEKTMQDFFDKKIQVLVSTTVIEVGIDVPNATCMVVEGAERFGLATLHQLRGRVGRGSDDAYCFLIPGGSKKEIPRLSMLKDTSDGFKVAQYDLQERGPGQFFGVKQHGLPNIKITDFTLKTVALAKKKAEELAHKPHPLWNPIKRHVEGLFSDLSHNARSR